jgi:UPF0755 protein
LGRLVKILILLGVLFGLFMLLCAGTLFFVSGGNPASFIQTEWLRFSLSSRESELNSPISADTTPRRFSVNAGNTPPQIAERLYQEGLIRDAQLFVDYVRVSGLDTEIEAGVYFLNQAQSLVQIAQAITDSASSYIPFRILEGWRIEEVAAAIDNNRLFGFSGVDFLAVVGPNALVDPEFSAFVSLPAGASLEGFLFPDSYQLPPEITPEGLRDLLTQTFRERITPQMLQDAQAQNLTLYQVVTIASIAERESVHADENSMITSAYRNRLNQGMKLDADPTVQYGIGYQNGSWWPQITQADYVNAVHAYNTYLNTGLPPGPIANPGISAIQAAIYPAESDFIFFRAKCDGSGYHNFARTFEEHLANGCS